MCLSGVCTVCTACTLPEKEGLAEQWISLSCLLALANYLLNFCPLPFRFCEEDIEQILSRRTQVINIETEGPGSTFAKVISQQCTRLIAQVFGVTSRQVFGMTSVYLGTLKHWP